MKRFLRRFRKIRSSLAVAEILLGLRALLFLGSKYRCPCCGWRVRAFTAGGGSLRQRELSYCPRCNSKSRHRRIWLFLETHTNLFNGRLRLLEVGPKFSFARRFSRMTNVDYVAGDLKKHPNADLRFDVVSLPLCSGGFDALICMHVLEEVVNDQLAMDEIYRVLKPGGWAVVSVPTNMASKTYEDWSIVKPAERHRAFGEPAHVRIYGYDLEDRLRSSGFEVRVDLSNELPVEIRSKYGLRNDENIFFCKKT